jgi:4'-phosphopantetheinyl transferase
MFADASLTPEETERRDCYSFARDAERFVLGRFFLRLALAAWANDRTIGQSTVEPATRIKFQERTGQAPTCEGAPAFSLSRSGKYLLVGIGQVQALGVDIETHDQANNFTDAMITQFFSADEIRDCNELPPIDRKKRFLTMWTGKEAIVKAAGLGLRASLREITLVGEQIVSKLSFLKRDESCRLRLIDQPDASLALAWW